MDVETAVLRDEEEISVKLLPGIQEYIIGLDTVSTEDDEIMKVLAGKDDSKLIELDELAELPHTPYSG